MNLKITPGEILARNHHCGSTNVTLGSVAPHTPDQPRAGDTLVVPKLDRLARSVPDARDIGDSLAEQGVAVAPLAAGGSTERDVDRRRCFILSHYHLNAVGLP